jgi:hypothetical protein
VNPAPYTTTTGPTAGTARLRLKPEAPTVSGHVDGAWWPHSRDLTAELPSLVEGLGPRVGTVTRVSYHLDTWEPAPRRVPVGPVRIALEGFRTTDPHLLTVLGRTGARLLLLVIPSTADEAQAQAALEAASGAGDLHSTADLLATRSDVVAAN